MHRRSAAAAEERSGVTVDDIAKRLIDYGFHAPTMSFPVAGTLMIEPTESESKAELDRFCDAMIAIRDEIARDRGGPHGREEQSRCGTRRTPSHDLVGRVEPALHARAAASRRAPSAPTNTGCPVGRVDNVYGDRNLVCTCPPVESRIRKQPSKRNHANAILRPNGAAAKAPPPARPKSPASAA